MNLNGSEERPRCHRELLYVLVAVTGKLTVISEIGEELNIESMQCDAWSFQQVIRSSMKIIHIFGFYRS
jgi:hypothetical protein